jgi:inorganic pyrophosphatase
MPGLFCHHPPPAFCRREYRVQPIGILEMIENGEQDWKLLARLPDEEVPVGKLQDLRQMPCARTWRAFIHKIFTAYPDVRIEETA